MKRIHWWTLLGVAGTGLTATFLGQAVLGQPDVKGPAPLPPLVGLPVLPPVKGIETKAEAPKELEVLSGSLPLLPVPTSGPTGPISTPAPALPSGPAAPFGPAPTVTQTEAVAPLRAASNVEKQRADSVPLDVQPGRQQPSISIEWGGPPTARINQPMSCQIVVRNMATTPVHNVVIRHRLGQGVTCKTSEPKAADDAGELSWRLGTMAPNQTQRLDLLLVSKTRGPLNCQATATFTAVAAHQVQVREPLLNIKMRTPDKIIAGESVTLLFAISNPGDGVAELVKVKTVLPDGLEHPRGKVVEFDVGNLAPKEIKTMQLVCVAKGSGAQKCSIVATGDGNLTSTDSAQLEILVPKIEVALSGPKLRYLDRHAIYVLKVTNPGSAPATNIEVLEQIPTGFKFHQANHGGKYQETTRQVSWALGDLPPGQSREVAVDVIPIETGDHRLLVQARTARGLKAETEVHTMVEGLPSLFMEVAHVDDPIEVGAETAYEIRVANQGTKTETNVEVICTLPEQLEFRGAKCSTTLRYRQEGRELIFEALPRLAPKADVIYRVQVKGIAPGDIRFRTRIRADGLKVPVLREESTRIYSDEAPIRSSSNNTPPAFNNAAPTPTATPAVPTPTSTPTPTSAIPTPSDSVPMLPIPTPSAPEATNTLPAPTLPTVPTLPNLGPAAPTPAPIAAPIALPLTPQGN